MINVSIVTYRTPAEEVRRCLQALMLSQQVHRIYIVDNGSEERIRALAGECSAGRVVYIPSANRGYGAGHNRAIRLSLGQPEVKYHLVMNSDVQFDPGTIEAITEMMDGAPDVALTVPRVIYPDGRIQHVARLLPTPFDMLLRRFLPASWFKKRRQRYTLTLGHDRETINAPYLLGSFMTFRLDALREEGLFDERFFMYPEDIDITRRLHERHRTLYWPGVTIVHAHRAASYHSARMARIHIANMARYFCKWGWLIDPRRRRFNRRVLLSLKTTNYANGHAKKQKKKKK